MIDSPQPDKPDKPPKIAKSIQPFLLDEKTPVGFYEVPNDIFKPSEEPKESKERPGFVETFQKKLPEGFLFRKFSAMRNQILTNTELVQNPDEQFDFFQDKYMSLIDPEYYSEASTANTEGEFFRKVADIWARQDAAQASHEASWYTDMGAGLLADIGNPLYMLPFASGLFGAKMLPSLKPIIQNIGIATMGAGIDELDLAYNHNARTAQEALLNSIKGGLFAGIVGGAFQGVRSGYLHSMKAALGKQLEGYDIKFRVGEKGEPIGFTATGGSAGAMDKYHLDLVGQSVYGWGKNGQFSVGKPLLFMAGKFAGNPLARGLLSKSPTMKRWVNEALEHNLDLNMIEKNFEAPPEALQTLIDNRRTATLHFQMDLADAYDAYAGIDPNANRISKVAKRYKAKDGQLSFPNFSKEFYRGVINAGEHENGTISSHAKKFIKNRLEPIGEELIELGLLPEGITPFGAAQHVMRVYDRDFLKANQPKALKFLMSEFNDTNEKIKQERMPLTKNREEIRDLREKMKAEKDKIAKAEIKKKLEQLKEDTKLLKAEQQEKIKNGVYSPDMIVGTGKKKKLRKYLDPEQVEASAKQTLQTLTGLGEEQLNKSLTQYLRSGTGGANSFKRRTLMIPDEKLLDAGFLVPDIRVSFNAYNLRMSRILEMEKYAKRMGYDPKKGGSKLEFLSQGIRNDYDILMNDLNFKEEAALKAPGANVKKIEDKFGKKRINLDKDLARDIHTASVVYKRLMGEMGTEYGPWLKGLNTAKKWLYATELGGLSLLMMQEFAAPIFRQGFRRYLGQGPIRLLRAAASADKKYLKDMRRESVHLGLGIEMATAHYQMNFAFDRPSYVPLNFVERMSDKVANVSGILNLSTPMGDISQFIAASSSTSSILTDLGHALEGKLSSKYHKRLLNLRIDPNHPVAKTIIEQRNKYGRKAHGGWIGNIEQWDIQTKEQRQAKALMEGAVRKDVKSVQFSGSNIASYPVWGEPNGFLGAALMYMGWGFNATTNFTVPLFQKFNSSRIGGALSMIAVASLVDPIRKFAAGKDLTEDDLDPWLMFQKGLLNSGVGGVFADMASRANTIGNLVPGKQLDRFRDVRSLIQFGPERLLIDGLNIIGMAGDVVTGGQANKKDMKRLIKNVLPILNMIYMRKLMNDWIDSWDIPDTREKAEKLKEWR